MIAAGRAGARVVVLGQLHQLPLTLLACPFILFLLLILSSTCLFLLGLLHLPPLPLPRFRRRPLPLPILAVSFLSGSASECVLAQGNPLCAQNSSSQSRQNLRTSQCNNWDDCGDECTRSVRERMEKGTRITTRGEKKRECKLNGQSTANAKCLKLSPSFFVFLIVLVFVFISPFFPVHPSMPLFSRPRCPSHRFLLAIRHHSGFALR